MDGTVGEIRLFAGNFPPRDWAICLGQQVALRSNTALYAILGVNFGGNGTTIFQLPDFAGRTAIGVGQGNGLSPYEVGEQDGTVSVTITSATMPMHTHTPTFTLSAAGSGTATLQASNMGDAVTPAGNFIGSDANFALFTTDMSANVPMATASIELSNVTANKISSVTLAPIGGSTPHNNMQPYLALNYIICLSGSFPARN